MAKINLTDEDLRILSESINNQTEIPEELILKLSPGFFEKLRQAGKFDYRELDKYKIPTIEYAGKRPEAVILIQAAITGGAAPLQIIRSFANGKNGDWKNLIVQGDNLQFLKTCYMNQDPLIKDKVKGKVKLIYIDPPFGTGDEYGAESGVMSYSAKTMGGEFIEGLRERLIYLKEILSPDGSIIVRIDYHFGHYLKIIMDELFNKGSFRNEIILSRGRNVAGAREKMEVDNDFLLWYSKDSNNYIFNDVKVRRPISEIKWTGFLMAEERFPRERKFLGKILIPPSGQHFSLIQEKVDKLLTEYFLRLRCKECGALYYKAKNNESLFKEMKKKANRFKFYDTTSDKTIYGVESLNKCIECKSDSFSVDYLGSDEKKISNIWLDIESYSKATGYPTENSEDLLGRVTDGFSNQDDIVLDVFGGSGTTAAVAEKLGRRWIMCDFGKHAIYTMQKRLLNIADSKKLGNDGKNEKYGQPPKPFCVVSAGAYDFSKIMNLRKNKDAYISFVLGLFGISREDTDFSKKYKLSNIYAEKENDPVEVYPVWEDEYLKNIRINEGYLKDILEASGGKLKGDYYIVTPETCTVISDTTLKNRNNEKVNFKLLKFPYKVLEDVSRHFQIEEQASSEGDINRLISSAGFYFNEEVKIEVEKVRSGIKINKFKTVILDKNKERFKGLEGLSMILIDVDYDGKIFDMDIAIYSKEIDENGFIKVEGIAKDSHLIAIDKHGNESKITKIG